MTLDPKKTTQGLRLLFFFCIYFFVYIFLQVQFTITKTPKQHQLRVVGAQPELPPALDGDGLNAEDTFRCVQCHNGDKSLSLSITQRIFSSAHAVTHNAFRYHWKLQNLMITAVTAANYILYSVGQIVIKKKCFGSSHVLI